MIKVELTIRGRVKTEWIKEGWIECCCQSEETKIDNVQIHLESRLVYIIYTRKYLFTI